MNILENALISIVLPVYNVEAYLNQCLESVCNQSYRNIEIILINDGSTDDSEKICVFWKRKDARIRYFNQKNRGPGPTRNRGIQLAKGRYITFIDSDDWVSKDYLENLYRTMREESADICSCCFQKYDEENKTVKRLAADLNKNRLDDYILQFPHIAGRLYKIILFTSYNIEMPMFLYEDLATYPLLAILAKKISYVDQPLYYYRVHTGNSIMDNLDNIEDYPKALTHLIREFYRLNEFDKYEEVLMNISVTHMSFSLRRIRRMENIKRYNKIASSFKSFLDSYFSNWRQKYENKFWVWGSYNLSRTANYLMFEYDLCAVDAAYYGFSSIISLMSNECTLDKVNHNNVFRLNMVNRDFTKSFKNAEVKKSDYILIDFLEERYDIIKIYNSYITKSEALEESSYIINEADIIKRNSQTCEELWKKSCLKFIKLLKNKFSSENIILIEMYLCEKYVVDEKEGIYTNKDIYDINRRLSRYYSFFKRNLPGIRIIKVPEPLNYTGEDIKFGYKPYYLNRQAYWGMARTIQKEM